jgi:hypothetical protein
MKVVNKFNDQPLSSEDRERVASLSNGERQELVRSILVRYPSYKEATTFVSKFHYPVVGGAHSRGRLGVVLGESRAGKSFLLQDYSLAFGEVAPNQAILRKVVYVEIINGMSPHDIALKTFLEIGFKSIPKLKTAALMQKAIEALPFHGVELLIFDDIDNALSDKRPHNSQISLGFVKAILDADACNVLCAGRPPLYNILKTIPQLEGRGGLPNHSVHPYRWRFAKEREQIRLLLNSIDDRLPFRKKSNLGSLDLAPHFYLVSHALIGRIMNYVEDAAAEAINDGSDCVQRDHLIYAATLRKAPGETFTPFLHEVDPERLDVDQAVRQSVNGKGHKRIQPPKDMFNK